MTPEKTARVVQRARELAALKVPFVHQGRSLQGIDCVGALAYILEYEGDVKSDYPRDPVNGELETYISLALGEPILEISRAHPLKEGSQLKVGDILSMQYAGPIRHVAIVLPYINQQENPGGLSIVHTDSHVGFVTECILDTKMLRRIVKVWRIE